MKFSGSGTYPATKEGVERISKFIIESMEEGLKTSVEGRGTWSYTYEDIRK